MATASPNLVDSLRNLGAMRIASISLAGIIMLAVFVFLTNRLTSPIMTILYSDLNAEDSGKLSQQLQSMGIEYEIRAGGSQILVPSNKVLELRMTLAQSGLPSQGSVVGYEIFDRSETLGSSNFVHNVNLLRALEGELSRTIASFDNVAKARVHLVIPKRQLFLKDQTEPSASIILDMIGKRRLKNEQVESIRHFIASAIPKLEPGNVTIVSSDGNLLSRGTGDDEIGGMATTSQELKVGVENRLKKVIESIVERSVGVGKVETQVSVDLDFDRIVTNSEVFDPEGQVPRSTQATQETEINGQNEGGEVSVANNLPEGNAGSGAGGEFSKTEKIDETTNFEISKKITNHIKESGSVKRISVAVLVDGVYETVEDPETGADVQQYSSRSQEELDQIAKLVKSSIGFDEARGDTVEVINLRFTREFDFLEDESAYDWLKRDFSSILKTLVIGVVAILVILLVIKPMVNRAFEVSAGDDIESQPELTKPAAEMPQPRESEDDESLGGLDVSKLQNRVVKSSIKKISTVASTNPQETVAVMREWLNQR